MKKQDLPQDESNLKSANMTEILYVTDENDNYTTANSTGWDVKKAALDESMELIYERIEEAKQKLKDEELTKFIYFYNDAHRWKKFMILKEYFEHLKSTNTTDKEWLDWAEKKLDWYNPAKNAEDNLMEDVDKNSLEIKKKNRWEW